MSSSIATKEYKNADIETGQEEAESISSSSTDTATAILNQTSKHHKWLVIGITSLLLIVRISTLSLKYTANKSAVSKQTRNLIDLSSWASMLGSTPSPTKSPTQKPIIDMSDWHDALGPTPPVRLLVVVLIIHVCVDILCISCAHSLQIHISHTPALLYLYYS